MHNIAAFDFLHRENAINGGGLCTIDGVGV